MSVIKKENCIIIGAGLAGCVMAILLAKKGFDVTLYEIKSDPRKAAVKEGKSYNVQFYPRGIEALKKLDIWDDTFTEVSNVVKGYMNHIDTGNIVYTPLLIDAAKQPYQIHREVLYELLLKKTTAYKNITIHFMTQIVGIERDEKIVSLMDKKTNGIYKKKASVIIGADGINSLTRSFIQKETQTTLKQETFPWEYKEIVVPAKEVKKLGLKANTIHRWPRSNSLLIGFPNKDTSLTFMLMLPLTGRMNFSALTTEAAIRTFVTETYTDLVPILPLFTNALLNHPIGKLMCVITSPGYYKDCVVLIGDAAHAILPFYGIGMNAAFEDCLLLSELMTKYNNDWKIVFSQFQTLRKPETDIIYQLAKDNFFSLKDQSRRPAYLIKEKILTMLHLCFPSVITPPLYKSVIHTTDAYTYIYNRHKKQEKILQLLGIDIIAFLLCIPYLIMQSLHTPEYSQTRS